MSKLNQV